VSFIPEIRLPNLGLVTDDPAKYASGLQRALIEWIRAAYYGVLKIDGSNADREIDVGSEDVTTTGMLTQGTLVGIERDTDPTDPAEGRWVIWMSDGTGAGDDGDLMIKLTAGGVTKTGTLADHSTL